MLTRNNNTHRQDINAKDPIYVIIFDKIEFIRSFMAKAVSMYSMDIFVSDYLDIDAWKDKELIETDPVVLLWSRDITGAQLNCLDDISRIHSVSARARVVIVSDVEAPTNLAAVFDRGACGYIPGSSSLEVAVAAIRLVRAGGVFIPVGCLSASQPQTENARAQASRDAESHALFTPQQLAVIDKLRQGESNKRIAYDLSISECTVKVHVRNIMHKIKARNRTEIAFLTNDLFDDAERRGHAKPYASNAIPTRSNVARHNPTAADVPAP